MTEALYLLSPPPRRQLIEEVVNSSESLVKRLQQSREIARIVDAEVRVGRRVLTWWRDIKKRKKLAKLMNFTTKAVKINKELQKLYDRSHESLQDGGDDGSSVAGDGSVVDSLVDDNASQMEPTQDDHEGVKSGVLGEESMMMMMGGVAFDQGSELLTS